MAKLHSKVAKRRNLGENSKNTAVLSPTMAPTSMIEPVDAMNPQSSPKAIAAKMAAKFWILTLNHYLCEIRPCRRPAEDAAFARHSGIRVASVCLMLGAS